MKTVQVRCWEVIDYRDDGSKRLFITYPEDNSGHSLITCLSCGVVYAVTVALEVYVGPPLSEKLRNMHCIGCGRDLTGNFAEYPESYWSEGKIYHFKRNSEIPPDDQSIIHEFPGVYE